MIKIAQYTSLQFHWIYTGLVIGLASGVIGTFVLMIIIISMCVLYRENKNKKEPVNYDECDTNHVVAVKWELYLYIAQSYWCK